MELSQLHHLLFFSPAIPSQAFYGQLSSPSLLGPVYTVEPRYNQPFICVYMRKKVDHLPELRADNSFQSIRARRLSRFDRVDQTERAKVLIIRRKLSPARRVTLP